MQIKLEELTMTQSSPIIRKCLFPAAGYGTRFLPATKAMPKEMLPILNKPLIQYGVEEALEAGIHHIAFVTGRGKRAIEDHFDINYEIENEIRGSVQEKALDGIRNIIAKCRFSYTRQLKIEGLGQAILTGEPLIGNEPFAVVLADDLCIVDKAEGVLSQMLKVFNKYHCSVVAVEEVAMSEIKKYGVLSGIECDDGVIKVNEMIEKPDPKHAPSNLGIIGRYILTPDIFDILRSTRPGRGGEIQITDALREQAICKKVLGFRIKAKRFDCGSVAGFVAATNYLFERGSTS
jgi:UTP--glucose-1-phosphate uridylyltransferase